jgi:Flp pilus assembly pilin Flp
MPATKIKIHNQKTGVSMAEYGLIGASVLVVAVSALILLGKTLTASLGTFGNSLSRPTASPPTLSSAPVKPSVPPQAPIASQSNFPGKQLQISLNSGQNLNISGYPDNLEKSVQTAGANGTTNQLADTIAVIAHSLLTSNEITETEYNQLIQLANQGHELGKLESLIEQASQQANGGREFQSATVQMDGKTYTASDILDQYGWTSDYNSIDINSIQTARPATRSFIELRNQVLQSGAMISNPSLKSLVENLSNNILHIAKASSLSADWAMGDGRGVDSYQSYTSDIPSLLSAGTHQNSMNICTLGNGQDSGIYCQ